MHYHLEIVMPPTDDIETAVSDILLPFSENETDEEGNSNTHAFWDWYKIGGRFSGQKAMAHINPDRLDKFYDALKEKKVTVSCIRTGKQTLSPASQAIMVDELWREWFPESAIKECPLFDNYKGANGDVQKFNEVCHALTAAAVMFAGLNHSGEKLEATYFIQNQMWNGVSWIDTKWDGTFGDAHKMFLEQIEDYNAEYKEKVTPQNDWLVVTVDYHC